MNWTRTLRSVVYTTAVTLLLTQTAFAAALVFLKHTDREYVAVTGGSMQFEYAAGDAVILDMRERSPQVGDIVTYSSPSGALTTHRVIELIELQGVPHLRTQGDANPHPDPQAIPAQNVVGYPEHHLPYGGHLSMFLLSPVGRLVTYGPVLVLMIAGQISLVVARARRNDRGSGQLPNPAAA